MSPFFVRSLGVLLLTCSALAAAEPDAIVPAKELPASSPWKLAELSTAPEFEWLEAKDDKSADIRPLAYAGEPYKEKAKTKVFGYYASPATLKGDKSPQPASFPGVVLVHGGGGTAFREWARLWANRGYAAICMDLAGKQIGDDGGPDQDDGTKFADPRTPVTNHWPYHAVANVIRAHSLLRSFPEVDRNRTALTGISWGGYLTCIVASVDTRFKAAVPVYGCGFLHENSFWLAPRFEKMSAPERDLWVKLYDPSQYLPACHVPIFFVNGTNDFAYPLDSYKKSYAAVPGEKNIRITVNMPHGHEQGWAPAEIGAFIDSKLLPDAKPLIKLGKPEWHEGTASVPVGSDTRVKSAAVNYTTESGPINKRNWKTVDATQLEKMLVAGVPAAATVWFFTATDDRGLTVSSAVKIGWEPEEK